MKVANLDGRADARARWRGSSTSPPHPTAGSVPTRWRSTTTGPRSVDFAAGVTSGATDALDEARLGAPSPTPRQVFAIGLNYRSPRRGVRA